MSVEGSDAAGCCHRFRDLLEIFLLIMLMGRAAGNATIQIEMEDNPPRKSH